MRQGGILLNFTTKLGKLAMLEMRQEVLANLVKAGRHGCRLNYQQIQTRSEGLYEERTNTDPMILIC